MRPLPRKLRGVKLEVVEGDITRLEVDAIANAANDRLWMGAGVAGAIKNAGGEEIEREAVAKGPIEIGDAVASGAGRLPAQHVVHEVTVLVGGDAVGRAVVAAAAALEEVDAALERRVERVVQVARRKRRDYAAAGCASFERRCFDEFGFVV